ncbi:MAG: antitoxin Xre/MbcA/ParS toxin-binding domain-containing protein [Lysobacterales bacterium]
MALPDRSAPDTNYRSQVDLIRSGVPVEDAVAVMESCRIPIARFAGLLGTSERKWSRLRSEGAGTLLSAVESDRLLRVREVLEHAVEVFDRDEDAITWLSTPLQALSGDTPLSLLDTDAGIRAVDAVLTRLEFGVFG